MPRSYLRYASFGLIVIALAVGLAVTAAAQTAPARPGGGASPPLPDQGDPSGALLGGAAASPETPASPTGIAPLADACIDCTILYACDCAGGLWRLDQETGESSFIGPLPEPMLDIAISADLRLYGTGSSGQLWEISTCDATGTVVGLAFANALAGFPFSTDLYSQGPPLQRIETTGSFPIIDVGGDFGSNPPDWCGFSSGDLSFNSADGLFYSVLAGCADCPADDRVVKVHPATGDVVEELGCLPGPLTVVINAVYGLAFDGQGRLWAMQGTGNGILFQVDTTTGFAGMSQSVTGGLTCVNGLAACPFDIILPPPPPPTGPACDVKPGSDVNPINTRSRGVIPVAILGSSSFDVNEIDPSTVAFGPDAASPAHKVGVHYDDVDQDGVLDALFHFRTQETGIEEGDEEACISWMNFAGDAFECCDEIRTVPVGGHPGGGRSGSPSTGSDGGGLRGHPACGGIVAGPGGPLGLGRILGALLPWLAILAALGALRLAGRRPREAAVGPGSIR